MISVLFPSRGRPHNIARMVNSARDTASDPSNVEFSIYLDDDDLHSIAESKALGIEHITVGPRIVLSQMWNKAYEVAQGPIYMHGGDDIVFRTERWDDYVETAFRACKDKILLVHGRDGHWEERFGTHSFIHENWIKTVGYFVPPYFSCDYNDTWLNEVANALRRRKYIGQILTEHLHPAFGKAEWDLTHTDRVKRGALDNVEVLYNALAKDREEDIRKLATFIEEFRGSN